MIIPCKNRIQNSNFRLLGWNIRAGLGHNYNQGNLCGVGSVNWFQNKKSFYNSICYLITCCQPGYEWWSCSRTGDRSLTLFFVRFFPYFYNVREIVWWRSSTIQPLNYLAVRHKWQWSLKGKRAEELNLCLLVWYSLWSIIVGINLIEINLFRCTGIV